MPFDARLNLVAVAMAAGLLLLNACSIQTTTQARAGDAREAGSAAAAPEVVSDPVLAPERASEVDSELEAVDKISQILAERRRGDYPEIEVLESGFTITEQAQIRNDARSDYERALSLLRQERYQGGIAILRNIAESTPDATAPYIDLAIAYGHVGDFVQAEEALTTANLLSPDNPIVHNELGIVYRKTGRFAAARASYEQALVTFSEFHFARRNLAVLCDLYLADLDCALQNYRAYLESVGTDSEVEIWVADLTTRLAN